MDREQFAAESDMLLDKYENLIRAYCKNNEEFMKQAILLMRRSTRMVKLSMYSQDCNEVIPVQVIEKDKELVNKASNEILNEIKRTNNIKRFNQDNKLN